MISKDETNFISEYEVNILLSKKINKYVSFKSNLVFLVKLSLGKCLEEWWNNEWSYDRISYYKRSTCYVIGERKLKYKISWIHLIEFMISIWIQFYIWIRSWHITFNKSKQICFLQNKFVLFAQTVTWKVFGGVMKQWMNLW